MEITKAIKDSVKTTVGYDECANKESFMVGCSVAFMRAEGYYNGIIKQLTLELENYKSSHESILADMGTLTGIIKKYTYDE